MIIIIKLVYIRSSYKQVLTLKVLSTLYLYLCLDFQAVDKMVCDVFPGSVNFTLRSVNYFSAHCPIQEVCWSSLCYILSLFHVYSLKLPQVSSSTKYMFTFTVPSCAY